jgi:hypothetical protein
MTAPKRPDKPVRTGGGLTGALAGMLRLASRKAPLTRADAVRKLCKRFPGFDPADVARFVDTNLPNRLRRFRGLRVENDGHSPRGYWMAKKKAPRSEDE